MSATLPSGRSGHGNRELAGGEFLLTSEDFRQIAAVLHADAGIYLQESKVALVYSRLAKRLRALGLENFRDYCALVSKRSGLGERQKMISALTTNVTRFFREPHHFDHLKNRVLPPLIEAARRGGRLRIWSAGCSNGPEPYSIALSILSLMPDAVDFDIKVLATDIDTNMVAEGERGIYSQSAVASVPPDLRSRWFATAAAGRALSVGEELKQLVAFRELNLIGPWPMKGLFQAIFCRNVVIYFDEPTQDQIWERFVPLLSPGGWLCIGHAERLSGPAAAQFRNEGITTYRLRVGAKP